MDPDAGAPVNGQMADYKIPTTLDVPTDPIVEFAENVDPSGMGVKSVAESAALPPAPAIANAVSDAIGVRIHELPITPDNILHAIREKGT